MRSGVGRLDWEAGVAAPVLPGRLVFSTLGRITVVQGGRAVSLATPEGFIPAEVSPQGTWVVGSAPAPAIQPGRSEMMVAIFSVSTGQLLPLAPLGDRVRAAWSPQGDRIAVIHPSGPQVHVYRVDGALEITLPVPEMPGHSVYWSPDGDQVAVTTGAVPVNEQSLWVADLRQADGFRLVARQASGPFWSPGGDHFYYKVYSAGGARVMREVFGLQAAYPVLSAERIVQARPDLEWLFQANGLSPWLAEWSPSGDQMAFQFKAAGRDPRFGVAVTDASGGDLRVWILPLFKEHPLNQNQHPPRPCRPGSVRWLAGGDRLVVPMYGPGCDGVVTELDAGSLTPVRELAVGPDPGIRYSPDRAWMAIDDGSGRVQVIRLEGDQVLELSAAGVLLHWGPPSP